MHRSRGNSKAFNNFSAKRNRRFWDLTFIQTDHDGLPKTQSNLNCHENILQKHAFSALSSIAKHIPDFAELVAEAEIFPQLITSLRDKDNGLQRECAILIREICKHTYELCQLIVNNGGINMLVSLIQESKGSGCLPGIMALGYISAHSDALAANAINAMVFSTCFNNPIH